MIIKEGQSEENKVYNDFVDIISSIKEVIRLLNLMNKIGNIPEKQFYETIDLKSMMGRTGICIKSKIENLKNSLYVWNKRIKTIFKNTKEKSFEDYYLTYIIGKNLIKINKTNYMHYLKYICPKLNFQDNKLKRIEGR